MSREQSKRTILIAGMGTSPAAIVKTSWRRNFRVAKESGWVCGIIRVNERKEEDTHRWNGHILRCADGDGVGARAPEEASCTG